MTSALREYFKLAVGNLSHRKMRSVLTMVGIFIGIAAIISLISLGQGLKGAIGAQFSALGSDRLIIQAKGGSFGPPGQNSAATLTKDDLRKVQKAQYVRIGAGRLLRVAVGSFNRESTPVFLASVPDDREDERQLVLEVTKPKIAQGRMLQANDRNKMIAGANWLTDKSFGKELKVGDKILINNTMVEIVGIMQPSGNPGFDRAFLMNEEPMRKVLGVPEEYSALTARADRDENVALAANAITRDLRRFRGEKERQESFTVQTSAQLLESVNTILNVIQAVLVGIAAISLIVGGIGIMNTMYTSTLERTKEIGIMKAIGATNNVVLTIFVMESAILGLIGGAIGILLGISLAKLVELAGTAALGPGILQAGISFGLIAGALLFSLMVGVISGLVPAYQASRMEPVEALSS
jgi:putative ABC transport system permease protein